MRTAAMEASALDQKFIGARARRDTPEPFVTKVSFVWHRVKIKQD